MIIAVFIAVFLVGCIIGGIFGYWLRSRRDDAAWAAAAMYKKEADRLLERLTEIEMMLQKYGG